VSRKNWSGHSGVEVGKYLNLRRAGASVAAGRVEKIIIGNPSCAGVVGQINNVPECFPSDGSHGRINIFKRTRKNTGGISLAALF